MNGTLSFTGEELPPPRMAALFKALANVERIRIAAALCDRPLSLAQIAREVDVPAAVVARHLARLRVVGLVAEEHQARVRLYRFQAQPLMEALGDVSREPSALPGDLEAYDRAVLCSFLEAGRLKALPVRRKKLDAVLRFLTRLFEPGRTYAEREVNEALRAYHDDYATLRRALIDAGFMRREHGRYWRVA